MGTPRASGRVRASGAASREARRAPRAAADPLTADIDDALEAELLASATAVASAEPDRSPAAPAVQGELSEADAAVLLGRAFQQAWTGRLVLTTRQAEKTIGLQAGRPVFAVSAAPEDRLAELLRRQGRIDADQRAQVALVSQQSGRRTGAVLVDLRICKPAELLPLLRAQHEEIILSTFAWEEGGYRFHAEAEVDPQRARLLRHPAVLVAEAIRRGHPLPRMRRRLGGGWSAFTLDGGPGARELIDQLAPDEAQRRTLPWLDGRRTLEEVVREGALDEAAVYGIAFVLWCFGVLHRGTPGRGALDRVVERDRLLARFALVQDADYFQVLGLSRDASTDEVVRAHQRLAAEVRPEAIAPAVAVSLAHEIAVVRQVLAEAIRVLGDEGMRRSYREHLVAPARPGTRPP